MTGRRPLRVGLIGAGRIGQVHGQLLARHVPDVELVALTDRLEDSARRLAADLGVEVASSADELLRSDLDVVAVCSSTDTHAALVVAAADAGTHVFCEKPISLHLPEVDRAIAAVDAAGVKLQVGFNRRFDASHRAVRDRVAAGDVGRVQLVRITSRDPEPPGLDYLARSGGIFLDMTVHDFDMARFVAGEEIVEVYASGAVLVDEAVASVGDVDTALVTLRYESGALGTIDNCRQATYGYDQRVEVLGSEGMVRSDNLRPSATVLENAAGALAPPVEHFFLERYLASYEAQWCAFVAAIRDDLPTEVDGPAGRAPIVLGLAALRSLELGVPVRVDEVVGAT